MEPLLSRGLGGAAAADLHTLAWMLVSVVWVWRPRLSWWHMDYQAGDIYDNRQAVRTTCKHDAC